MPLLDLFLTFLKIGTVSFGGGYGMLSILKDEVLSHGWLSNAELMNFIAVSESTPGPVAINMATFIGYSQGVAAYGTVLGGLFGAFLTTFAVVLPAFIIIFLIATIIKNLLKFAGVQAFLSGVRPVVVGLIAATAINLFISVLFGISSISERVAFDLRALIILIILTAMWFLYKKISGKKISPILLILFSALLGIIFYGFLGGI